jgi:hypothetical protein
MLSKSNHYSFTDDLIEFDISIFLSSGISVRSQYLHYFLEDKFNLKVKYMILNRELIVLVKFIYSLQHYQSLLLLENYQIVMIKNYLVLKKKRFVSFPSLIFKFHFKKIKIFRHFFHPLIIFIQNLVKNVLKMVVLLIYLFF